MSDKGTESCCACNGCRCAGEGTCAWCTTHCTGCGLWIPEYTPSRRLLEIAHAFVAFMEPGKKDPGAFDVFAAQFREAIADMGRKQKRGPSHSWVAGSWSHGVRACSRCGIEYKWHKSRSWWRTPGGEWGLVRPPCKGVR